MASSTHYGPIRPHLDVRHDADELHSALSMQRLERQLHSYQVRPALGLLIALALGATVHAIIYSGRLPDRVPTHFDGSGQPDSWGSKSTMIGLYMGVVWGCFALFLGLSWCIPRCPVDCINLPNKSYYLHPSRRQQTMNTLIRMMLILGAFTIAFLVGVFEVSKNCTDLLKLAGVSCRLFCHSCICAVVLLLLFFMIITVVFVFSFVFFLFHTVAPVSGCTRHGELYAHVDLLATTSSVRWCDCHLSIVVYVSIPFDSCHNFTSSPSRQCGWIWLQQNYDNNAIMLVLYALSLTVMDHTHVILYHITHYLCSYLHQRCKIL
jgi:Domain of unknown function (DUF1648)